MLNEYLQSGLKAAKGAYKSAKYQMEGLSEIEIKTRECTNSDPWGAHGKDLAVLARATHNREEMYLIMKTLWLRLEEREEKWRHCYKALNVIEYLVAHGHESCLRELKQNVRSIEYLDKFVFKDPSGRDQGINVRQKSATLVALLRDDARIAEAREKAARNRGRYSGISAEDVRSGAFDAGRGASGAAGARDGWRDRTRAAFGIGIGDGSSAGDAASRRSERDARRESSENEGDREFRAFSAAPAVTAPVPAPAPAPAAAPAPALAPAPFQADFGDFEDDAPAAPSAGGYVPKLVLSPAPSAAPLRAVALAPPPRTAAAPSARQNAGSAGGLEELFAGAATSPAPVPPPVPVDPFGDMFGDPAAPSAAVPRAAPSTAAQAATPELFSLDVPAAAPPPAMGGGGGQGALGPSMPPQMDLDKLYDAPLPNQMGGAMGGAMGGMPHTQQVPGFGLHGQGMSVGAPPVQQRGFGTRHNGMTGTNPMGAQTGAPIGGAGGVTMGGVGGVAQFGGSGFAAPSGPMMGGSGAGAGTRPAGLLGRAGTGGALDGLTADLFGGPAGRHAQSPAGGGAPANGGGGSLI